MRSVWITIVAAVLAAGLIVVAGSMVVAMFHLAARGKPLVERSAIG